MAKFRRLKIILFLLSFLPGAQVFAQSGDLFLGIRLSPGVRLIAKEIETKSRKKIVAEYVDKTETEFGSSYLSDSGTPIVLINSSLEATPKKLEAVIAHELLHLRLRVNGYPVFLFSPAIKTAKGLAQDVEQPNANDITSIIEHRIFKAELQRLGLYDLIDLAGPTAESARFDKTEDSQDDSINYARAILEYQRPQDIEEVRKIYQQNGWTRALREGKAIADIIGGASLQTPKDSERIFLRCLTILYSSPKSPVAFSLAPDRSIKSYRQLIINAGRPKRSR